MLKSGGWGGVVAYEIIVSAQGPNTSSFFAGTWGSVGTRAWTCTWTRA